MLDQGGTIDWDDFRFVLAIVRGGSVSAAARQLGVDHATVIRRVDRLEHTLSAKLFDRRKSGYLLTEAGQRFLELRRGNFHVLVDAEDVRELEPHRSDVELSGKLENVLRIRAVDVWRD